MSHFEIDRLDSHFTLRKKEVKQSLEVAARLPAAPSAKVVANRFAQATENDKKANVSSFYKSNFIEIVPKKPGDAKKIAKVSPSMLRSIRPTYPLTPCRRSISACRIWPALDR